MRTITVHDSARLQVAMEWTITTLIAHMRGFWISSPTFESEYLK